MNPALRDDGRDATAIVDTAMLETQVLSSGLMIRQDFAEAVRPVFFQTEHDEFLYATHGGTLFLVSFRGRVYGVTCAHVFGDFLHGRLFVTQERRAKKGSMPGNVIGLAYPSSPRDGAVGTDVTDLCLIQFSKDTSPDFFASPYVIDERTVATSHLGDVLFVAGVLKDKTSILPPDIHIGYCRLEFQDAGPSGSDPFLRRAVAQFDNPAFTSVTGISGSPIYDQTAHALCGMVVRGGMTGSYCTIHYLDVFDIVRFLDAASQGADNVSYTKIAPRPVSRKPVP
jgi:hypothetical protein